MICPSCRSENDEGAAACRSCGAALPTVAPGTVIASRYEVQALLGRGGMGAVYRAHDRILDETVALKILRPDVAGTPEMARRFRSEIKLARRVSHWNVCRIHEYGEDGGRQFISMELVEGTNLKEVLRREGPLAPDMAYDVALQAAAGLAAIHQVGIIHRDLKPMNLMRDLQGVVKVMDFGIARPLAAEGTSDSGTAGYVLGSPEYMSPEQARGRRVDFRSDIYSLGIVVFELFSGRAPFAAETAVATLLMHLEQTPSLEDERFLPALRPALRRALAKDPADRFGSAREFADALAAARAASGGETRPEPTPPRTSLRAARRAWFAGLAMALVAVLAMAFLRMDRPAAPTTPAPSPIPTAEASLPPATSATSPVVASSLPPTRPSLPARVMPSARAPDVAWEPTPMPVPSAEAVVAPPSEGPPTTPSSPASISSSPPTPQVGSLLVLATPWADVTVDGTVVGQTPLPRLPLSPGSHAIVLTHPDYLPFHRRVTVRAGETYRLVVDLPTEGVRRRR